jgi:hypothetical protein
MSILIDQNKNFLGQFGPVFRSSAIFFIPEGVNTTITVSNYWDFKNSLEVGLLFSIRDLDGNLIERREKYFDNCLVINERDWPISEGSVEVEAFGNKNLRIPYAAVMGIYETQTSISMVHSYGRNHNLIELEDGNFLTTGRESCWTIRHNENIRNSAVFHNGHLAVDEQEASLTLTNVNGEEKVFKFNIPSLKPFQTHIFILSTLAPNYKKWLNGSDGWGTLHFDNHTAFTRLLLVWKNADTNEVQVTHSNFDYSEFETNMIEATKPALMKWPSLISNSDVGQVVVYPKFAKGRYKISSTNSIYETDTGMFINVSNLERLEFISSDTNSLPSRIVTGFSFKKEPSALPMECSMGVVHEKRPPKRFHWSVVSKKFRSQLFFNAFPEFYDVPNDIFLVFRLYSPVKSDYVEKRIDLPSLTKIPDGIWIDELFDNTGHLDENDYCYVSMFSNFGGWYMYSSMLKRNSMTIEHSF